ncbi:hypothetical protein [Azospirillum doebereinerae]
MAADPAGMATTSEDFIKGLSLGPAPAPAPESTPLRTRGLSLGTGDVAPPPTPVSAPAAPPAPPPVTAQRPSVNFQVEFELNSATLSPKARGVLDQLGRALTAPELAGFRFELAGHTDVTGSAEHNLALSKRRAASVRDYLTTTFRIPSKTLTTAGYGSRRLLDPVNRTSGVNRRVEITNLGS